MRHPVATVQHGFATSDEGFLSLTAGATMVVTVQDEGGWWTGYAKEQPDQVGMFPSTYVKLNEAASEAGEAADQVQEPAQAEDAAAATQLSSEEKTDGEAATDLAAAPPSPPPATDQVQEPAEQEAPPSAADGGDAEDAASESADGEAAAASTTGEADGGLVTATVQPATLR